MLYIGLYKENMTKIHLSETARPRTLIFDKVSHLVDLYQVGLNSTHATNTLSLYSINLSSSQMFHLKQSHQILYKKTY